MTQPSARAKFKAHDVVQRTCISGRVGARGVGSGMWGVGPVWGGAVATQLIEIPVPALYQ